MCVCVCVCVFCMNICKFTFIFIYYMLQFPCCYPLQRLCNGLKTLNISPLIIVKFVKESYSSNKVEYVMLCLERKEEWGGVKGEKRETAAGEGSEEGSKCLKFNLHSFWSSNKLLIYYLISQLCPPPRPFQDLMSQFSNCFQL